MHILLNYIICILINIQLNICTCFLSISKKHQPRFSGAAEPAAAALRAVEGSDGGTLSCFGGSWLIS
jgi:hypothetical protein